MDAVFHVKAGEFDETLFRHIQSLLKSKKDLEITISINEPSTGILYHETKEEYFNRLLKAKENLDNQRDVILLKSDQLEEFEKSLLNES